MGFAPSGLWFQGCTAEAIVHSSLKEGEHEERLVQDGLGRKGEKQGVPGGEGDSMGQHGEQAGGWGSPSHPSRRPDPSLLGRSPPARWGGLAVRRLEKSEKGGEAIKINVRYESLVYLTSLRTTPKHRLSTSGQAGGSGLRSTARTHFKYVFRQKNRQTHATRFLVNNNNMKIP